MNDLRNLIKNRASLLGHAQTQVRQDALEIIEAGLRAADPGQGTHRALRRDGNTLYVGPQIIDLGRTARIFVVGAGKGSFPIAQALEEILGPRITAGVVVVKRGEKRRLGRIEVVEAGHPIPDADSLAGASKILALADEAGEGDLVFVAITGGASSLATSLPIGLKLADIQVVSELLLNSGADIRSINVVRRHLCQLKGGRLSRRIRPAAYITLTLNTAPPDLPWPDMCLPDPTTFQDAIDALQLYDIWDKVPNHIQQYLCEGTDQLDSESQIMMEDMRARIVSVGDPIRSSEAAADRARELGYAPAILGTELEGEAREMGIILAGIANEIMRYNRPFARPCALISAGETTVHVGTASGVGGPNQETVLGFALTIQEQAEVACLSIDTDGTDGPTDLAGGIVDGLTRVRATDLGVDLKETLKAHDSSVALARLGDAVITGHTGTNVKNLRVIVIR